MISRESVEFQDVNGDMKVKDIKIKVRYIGDSITLWIDDQFVHTEPRSEAKSTLGGMGLYLGVNGDVDIKRVEFREVLPFEEPVSEAPPTGPLLRMASLSSWPETSRGSLTIR